MPENTSKTLPTAQQFFDDVVQGAIQQLAIVNFLNPNVTEESQSRIIKDFCRVKVQEVNDLFPSQELKKLAEIEKIRHVFMKGFDQKVLTEKCIELQGAMKSDAKEQSMKLAPIVEKIKGAGLTATLSPKGEFVVGTYEGKRGDKFAASTDQTLAQELNNTIKSVEISQDIKGKMSAITKDLGIKKSFVQMLAEKNKKLCIDSLDKYKKIFIDI